MFAGNGILNKVRLQKLDNWILIPPGWCTRWVRSVDNKGGLAKMPKGPNVCVYSIEFINKLAKLMQLEWCTSTSNLCVVDILHFENCVVLSRNQNLPCSLRNDLAAYMYIGSLVGVMKCFVSSQCLYRNKVIIFVLKFIPQRGSILIKVSSYEPSHFFTILKSFKIC